MGLFKQLDVEMVDIEYIFYGPCCLEATISGKRYRISFDYVAYAQFQYETMKASDI